MDQGVHFVELLDCGDRIVGVALIADRVGAAWLASLGRGDDRAFLGCTLADGRGKPLRTVAPDRSCPAEARAAAR